MKTARVNYSTGSKFFHWLIAFLVICMLSFSFFLDDVKKPYQGTAYMIHKSVGLSILFLMLLRIIWIWYKGRPELPLTVPKWQHYAARTVQYCFYVFLIVMPLSGWIFSVAANHTPSFFGLFKVPLPIAPNKALDEFFEDTHTVIAWILIALVVLHVAGAFKHLFIDKDKVVQSMLPGK